MVTRPRVVPGDSGLLIRPVQLALKGPRYMGGNL